MFARRLFCVIMAMCLVTADGSRTPLRLFIIDNLAERAKQKKAAFLLLSRRAPHACCWAADKVAMGDRRRRAAAAGSGNGA